LPLFIDKAVYIPDYNGKYVIDLDYIISGEHFISKKDIKNEVRVKYVNYKGFVYG
jgi:hypothetical protein